MRNRRAGLRSFPTLALAAAAAASSFLFVTASSGQVKDHRQLKFPELRPFAIPRPERVVLDNKMVVMLLENHELPLVEVTAWIRTGSRLEPADKAGLAGVFGQVLRTGGTKSMTGDQIDDFLEARAAMVETNVGMEAGTATLSCLAQDLDAVLKVYADVLRNPAFSENKIAIARNQASSAIARRNDNPQGIMQREFAKIVYGADSPYARTSEYGTIESITRADLVAFHERYYRPDRIILGAVGDFDAKAMAGKIRAAFGDWRGGSGARPADPVASWQASAKPGVYYVRKEDMTQSDIILGHLGIRKDDPSFYAVEVLNEALGGGFGARLFSNVRSRKGLAYSVRGGVQSNFDYPGTFNVWMTTKTETTAAGIDALVTEIDDIVAKPPSDEEVKRAKASILNSFVFNYDSPAKVLRQQITYEYYGFPADYLARYRQNIEKVTTLDVARAAKAFVHRDRLVTLVVGPSKGQDRPLETFGPVTKLDITIPDAKGPAPAAASADALEKGRALFAKVVEALGGASAVDGVKAIRTVSSGTVKSPGGEMNVKVVSTLSLPDRLRQEMTTPMGRMVSILNGDEGYVSLPMGTRPIPESRRSELTRTIRRQTLFLAQHRDDPAFKVQSLGRETVDGSSLEALLVSFGGEETRVFVEPSTGRVVRQVFRASGPGGSGEMVASFSDFRPASNVVLPFRTQTTMNGEMQQSSTAEEISVNPPLDDALFEKPEDASPSSSGDNTGQR